MNKYFQEEIRYIQKLRSTGKTYGEIRKFLGKRIPKSTLSYLCRGVTLPKSYDKKIKALNHRNLNKGRLIALEINKIKREEKLNKIRKKNQSVTKSIFIKDTAKIALSMLCLGEASKYRSQSRRFSLGNSDPRIIILFLKLLKYCFSFNLEKVRCTVQCRADQDTEELENYWRNITRIPKRLFYKPLIDPRTKGKPTIKKEYKGVLRVDYFDTHVQLELENLADLLYNEVLKGPEV